MLQGYGKAKIVGGFALMIADFIGTVAIVRVLPAIGGRSGLGVLNLGLAAIIAVGMSMIQVSLFNRRSYKSGDGFYGFLTDAVNFAMTVGAIVLNVLANYLFYNVSGYQPEQILGEMVAKWQIMKDAGGFGYAIQIGKFVLALIVSFLGERFFTEGLIDIGYLPAPGSVAGFRGQPTPRAPMPDAVRAG